MVDVLFFAELRDQAGKEKISVSAEGYTIKELKEEILSDYNLQTIHQAMIAVNEEYVNEQTVLKSGDTVAFIPPVSGG